MIATLPAEKQVNQAMSKPPEVNWVTPQQDNLIKEDQLAMLITAGLAEKIYVKQLFDDSGGKYYVVGVKGNSSDFVLLVTTRREPNKPRNFKTIEACVSLITGAGAPEFTFVM